MKTKVFALSIAAVMSFSGIAAAEEMAVQEAVAAAPVVEQAAPAVEPAVAADVPVAVGNKICPVSGEAISPEVLGKVTVEYKGKLYNLCCPGCKNIFLADGDKFSKKAEDEVSAAPGTYVGEVPAGMPMNMPEMAVPEASEEK